MSPFVRPRSTAVARRIGVAAIAAIAATAALGLVAGFTPAAAAADAAKVHHRNLLRAASFTAHGYAQVHTYDNWEGEGDFELSACGVPRTYDAAGLVNRMFRMYVGAQTRGEQVVLQFSSRADSAAYVRSYRDAVAGCADRTDEVVVFSSPHRPAITGVTSAGWWSTHTDEGVEREWGTISLVRDGDRVSVLSMYSATSRPRTVMDVPALMQDMGDRLALA